MLRFRPIPTRTCSRDERVADCSTAQEVALAALEASRPPSSSNTDIRTALLSPLCSGEDLSREDLPPREDLSDLSRVRLLVSNTPLRSEEGRHCPALLHGAARRECERRGSNQGRVRTLNGERSSGEVLTRMMRGPHCGGPHTREPTGTQSWLNNRVGLARAAVRPLEQAVELEGRAAPTTACSLVCTGWKGCLLLVELI